LKIISAGMENKLPMSLLNSRKANLPEDGIKDEELAMD